MPPSGPSWAVDRLPAYTKCLHLQISQLSKHCSRYVSLLCEHADGWIPPVTPPTG